ncbi:TPA_asm: hypothetical protein Cy-LDV1_g23 [Cyanophage Cy-LDV1]|nr:TPA_asm: hypothetical protein Cy-LDV1_g23 [Cyanophage Cy-LDV1]
MSNDYTLPPVPAHPDWQVDQCNWLERERDAIASYGHAVAAPLLARIAELEIQNTGLLDQHARDSKELRALCEQRDEYIVTSRRLQADKRALLQGGQEQASEIARLRAEVEALKSALAAEQADAERYRWLRDSEDVDTIDEIFSFTPATGWDKSIDAAIAARKGEGSEG